MSLPFTAKSAPPISPIIARTLATHKPNIRSPMMTGTNTTWHTLDTNWPATLATATASLILLQQHKKTKKNRPARPKEIYPNIL